MNSEDSADFGVRLLFACWQANLTSVVSLLRFGADPSFSGPDGQTPVHAAVLGNDQRFRERAEIVAKLAQAGARLDQKNNSGSTPLMLAARSEELQQALLAAGADTSIVDSNGDTALIWTISVNRVSSIDHLLNAGAKVDQAGQHGRTPLAWAAYRGNLGYARSLIGAGACIDVRDMSGATPLMRALQMRHADVAQALADAGADLQAKDHAGISVALRCARSNNSALLRRARSCGAHLSFVDEVRQRLLGLLELALRRTRLRS